MIVAMPLAIDKIEPDDWNTFNKIWEDHSDFLVKVAYLENNPYKSDSPLGKSDLWKSLDIFRSNKHNTIWDGPYFDIKEALPKMYSSILKLPFNVNTVRIISSVQEVLPHSDNGTDQWEVRAFLRCENPSKEWFFTPRNLPEQKIFIKMPNDTNWFAYNDKFCFHGSHVNTEIPKLLIQIFYDGNLDELVKNLSLTKYSKYTINF